MKLHVERLAQVPPLSMAVLTCIALIGLVLAGCGSSPGPHPQGPVIGPIPDQVLEELDTLVVVATASDPNNDPITWTAKNLPAGATFDAATARLTYVAPAGSGGLHATVTLTASDGSVATNATFSIDVLPAFGPPPPPVSTTLDGPANYGFLDAYGLVSSTQAASMYATLGGLTWVRNSGGQAGGLHWNRATATTDTFSVALSQADMQRSAGITPLVNFDPSNTRDNSACYSAGDPAHYPCYPDSFRMYVRASVNTLRGIVDWYQVYNEPMNSNFWAGSKFDYARLVQLTSDEVKKDCPECHVALGGMIPSYLDSVLVYLDILAGGGTGSGAKYYDAVDYHFFGLADTSLAPPDKRYDWIAGDLASIKGSLQRHGAATVPIWITETATYAGQPSSNGQLLPMQSETQQARGLVKRMFFPIANGVDVTLWSQITDTPCFGCPGYPPNNQFSYTGLLLQDKSTKKLSYYSMQKLFDKLKGLAWRDVQTVTAVTNVRVYVVPDSLGRRNYIAWWDYANESTPPPGKSVLLQFSEGTTQVQLTELVPNKPTGATVNPATDFVTSTLPADSKARVRFTLGRNPVILEPLPLAPRRPGS